MKSGNLQTGKYVETQHILSDVQMHKSSTFTPQEMSVGFLQRGPGVAPLWGGPSRRITAAP